MKEGIDVVLRTRDGNEYGVVLLGVPRRDDSVEVIVDSGEKVAGVVRWVTWTNFGIKVELR